MQDSCVTFFGNCVSQVSLLLSLLIPKRRELQAQSQPTENLQMSRCWPEAQHPPTQSHLPGKASEQTSKPTRALKGSRENLSCNVLLGSLALPLLPFAAELWVPCPPSHPSATSHRVKQVQSS